MLGNEYNSAQTALTSALRPTAGYHFRMFVLIAHAGQGLLCATGRESLQKVPARAPESAGVYGS